MVYKYVFYNLVNCKTLIINDYYWEHIYFTIHFNTHSVRKLSQPVDSDIK